MKPFIRKNKNRLMKLYPEMENAHNILAEHIESLKIEDKNGKRRLPRGVIENDKGIREILEIEEGIDDKVKRLLLRSVGVSYLNIAAIVPYNENEKRAVQEKRHGKTFNHPEALLQIMGNGSEVRRILTVAMAYDAKIQEIENIRDMFDNLF